jgi:hypothetical protein
MLRPLQLFSDIYIYAQTSTIMLRHLHLCSDLYIYAQTFTFMLRPLLLCSDLYFKYLYLFAVQSAALPLLSWTLIFLLQDGPLPYPDGDRLILGLSTIQVVALAIGSLLGLVALVVAALMVAKRLLPGCKNFKFASPQDAQILVIEGPEDGDTDEEEDENHEVESA